MYGELLVESRAFFLPKVGTWRYMGKYDLSRYLSRFSASEN